MAALRIPKEYLGAFKAGHRATARELIDDSFSRQLLKKAMQGCEKSKEALQFLTKFNNEYHKNVLKKDDPKALHNTDQLRKDCYDRENAKNRDVYTKMQIVRKNEEF